MTEEESEIWLGRYIGLHSRLNQVEANLMYINQEKFVQIVKRLDEIESRLIQLSVLNKVLKAAIKP